VRDVATGAAEAAVIGGAVAYLATGDRQKAVQAAKYNVLCYVALLPFGVVSGFALIFGLLAVVAGDFGFAFVLGLVTGVCTWACVGIVKHFHRRLRPIFQRPLLAPVP
jgi:hypothetical protein